MAEIKQCENEIVISLNDMSEIIKEIKEKAQILVDKYNVQDISVYIDESKCDILRDKKEVYVEVRIQE